MKGFLKNYTSDVPAFDSIAQIERVLIRCGVTGITKDYGPKGEIIGVLFHIPAHGKEATVRLPANKEKVLNALWVDYVNGDTLTPDGNALQFPGQRKKRKQDFADQAERTAWKIVREWIEIQMSMIQMQQAETIEVFLPYIWDGKQTVFQRVRDAGYRALLPEKSEAA